MILKFKYCRKKRPWKGNHFLCYRQFLSSKKNNFQHSCPYYLLKYNLSIIVEKVEVIVSLTIGMDQVKIKIILLYISQFFGILSKTIVQSLKRSWDAFEMSSQGNLIAFITH